MLLEYCITISFQENKWTIREIGLSQDCWIEKIYQLWLLLYWTNRFWSIVCTCEGPN